jgi:hypothetical protein
VDRQGDHVVDIPGPPRRCGRSTTA